MTQTYFDIFRSCFDCFRFGINDFEEISGISECVNFDCSDNGKTVGFASVRDDNIRLICVLPEYRGRGFGTKLLLRAEEYIRSLDYGCINIGGTHSRLFIGATCESVGFFEKYGYKFGAEMAEMCGDVRELSHGGRNSDNVRFGYFNGEKEALKKAVDKVDGDWTRYFDEGDVFCAFCGGEIASFCLLGDDETCMLSDSESRIGSIGCVGTVPEFRRRGIGLDMVALASKELEARGCDKIFIHYTHVYDWYAKLGYKTFLRLKLGGKPTAR